MKAVVLAMAVAGALASGAVAAQSDVLKTKGCLNCHEADKKKVGPSFKEIAGKRQGKQAELVAKLKDGKGHPKIAASDAELNAAVQQVLATK
jgi:cytochrome c